MRRFDREAYKAGYDRIEWKPIPPEPVKPVVRPARGSFPTPRLIRDFDEPVQSMADGKWYTSKAALARSARADHNPHGQDFVEIGNEKVEFREYKPDPKEEREALRKVLHDYDNGWRPEVVTLED